MSQIARVFVVLNLLLAAGFFFAAATFLGLNNDYKGKFESEKKAHDKSIEENKAAMNKQSAEIARLEGSNRALTEQRGNLEGVTATQKTAIESLEKSGAEKDRQLAEASRINNEHATNVSNMTNQVKDLTGTNVSLDEQKRQAVEKQQAAETKLDGSEKTVLTRDNTIAEHEKTINTLSGTLKQKDLMIDYAKSKGIAFDVLEIAPPLTGAVVNADNAMKLVQVNIGSSQGVQRGFTLDIVRGAQYIGQMRVDTVFASSAAGIMTLLPSGNQVMVGDRVTNRLN